MKRALAIAATFALVFTLGMPAAQANIHGAYVVNVTHMGHGRTFAIEQNTKAPLQDYVEALFDMKLGPWSGEKVWVQVSIVRLFVCSNQAGTNCIVVRSYDPFYNWFCPTANNSNGANYDHCSGVPIEANSVSTPWHDVVKEVGANGSGWSWYRSYVRFRVKWLELPGDPIGGFHEWESYPSHEWG